MTSVVSFQDLKQYADHMKRHKSYIEWLNGKLHEFVESGADKLLLRIESEKFTEGPDDVGYKPSVHWLVSHLNAQGYATKYISDVVIFLHVELPVGEF